MDDRDFHQYRGASKSYWNSRRRIKPEVKALTLTHRTLMGWRVGKMPVLGWNASKDIKGRLVRVSYSSVFEEYCLAYSSEAEARSWHFDGIDKLKEKLDLISQAWSDWDET